MKTVVQCSCGVYCTVLCVFSAAFFWSCECVYFIVLTGALLQLYIWSIHVVLSIKKKEKKGKKAPHGANDSGAAIWAKPCRTSVMTNHSNKESASPHLCAHTLSARGEHWLITLGAPHWDVRNNYLCLAATQDPPGEVIILTRDRSLQSQLIHISSGAQATRAIWMHGSNNGHYWTRQASGNRDFLIPLAQQLQSSWILLGLCHRK